MIQPLFRFLRRRVLRPTSNLTRVVALSVMILAYGSTGYLYFELEADPSLGWEDAIWYSFVTVTTVGYGDYYPSTVGGRYLVAVPLMFLGIGLLGYAVSLAASALIEAKSKEMRGMAEFKLQDHLVIVNFPGEEPLSRLLDELEADPKFGTDRAVVLIDEALTELPPSLQGRDLHFVRGNPTRDQTLSRASLDSARQAIVLSRALDERSDDRNVAITLAIEKRNPSVQTVVQCVDHTTEELLRKAGCDSIVCMSHFDALFLSNELLDPGLQGVLKEITSSRFGQQLCMTRLTGRGDFGTARERAGAKGHIAIGIVKGRTTHLNVSDDTEIGPDDALISIGPSRLGSLDPST